MRTEIGLRLQMMTRCDGHGGVMGGGVQLGLCVLAAGLPQQLLCCRIVRAWTAWWHGVMGGGVPSGFVCVSSRHATAPAVL